MAFVQDPNDPNNPQNQPGAQTGLNQPPQTASGIGAGATGVSSPQGATATPTSTKAPPVANMADYLKANAPQTVDMANKIAGNLTAQNTQLQTDLAQGQQNFESAVKAGSVQSNPDMVARAAASPSQFITDPNDVAEFERELNATYNGPQNFQTSDVYKDLSGKVQKAAQLAPDATNPNDIQPLVAGLETNPTPGMTSLDTLLLQENPEAMSTLTAARQPFSTLKQYLQDLLTKENQTAQDAKTATAAAPAAISAAFTGPNGVAPQFSKSIMDRLTQAQSGAAGYNKNVSDYVSFLNDLQEHLAPLEAYTGNIDWAPTSFSPVSASPTLETVASPQDFATQAALEYLLGEGYSNPVLNPNLASGAGTFAVPAAAPPSKADVIESLIPTLIPAADKAALNVAQTNAGPGFEKFNDTENALFYDYLSKLDPNLWDAVRKAAV